MGAELSFLFSRVAILFIYRLLVRIGYSQTNKELVLKKEVGSGEGVRLREERLPGPH